MNTHDRTADHEPLEVTSLDGMPMVKCSCDGENPHRIRWQSAYWLRLHWQGTQEDGVAALQARVATQAANTAPEESA